MMGRPEGVPVDCAAVVKEVLARVGGRGGGQAGMAQGGLQDSGALEGAMAMVVEKVDPTQVGKESDL